MIHIRGCWRVPEKRSDVRVSKAKAAAIHADLTSNKLEKEFDARMPKHFAERQSYIQQGGK
jgi:hypothetical protein